MTNLSLNKHQGQFKQFLKFSPLGKNRKYESLKEKLNVYITTGTNSVPVESSDGSDVDFLGLT